MKDLKTYLSESKMDHLYEIFKRMGMDESQLLAKLKYSDLEKIGIENITDRMKIFDIINEINQDIYNEDIEMRQSISVDDSKDSKNGFLFGEYEVSIGQRLASYDTSEQNTPRTSLLGLDIDDSLMSKTSESGIERKEERILVCVRKRPRDNHEDDVVDIDGRDMIVNEPKVRVDLRPYTEQHRFRFDYSFDGDKSNIDIYRESVKDVVNHVINGGFGTILAYGQTGTGKTYSMLEKEIGMVYLSIKDIMMSKRGGKITFCEIYMGQVYDLLDDSKKIQLREVNGIVYLSNAKAIEFNGCKEALDVVDRGISLRRTGVTGANSRSSRSHAVILMTFFNSHLSSDDSSGSIVFVDLAGSERGSDRKDVGSDARNEGAEINKSLLALKECIRGIERDQRHLPFRQSKLTQILKNSFTGASKTCLIATISSIPENVEHTLNTLRYAARIKEGSKSKDRKSNEQSSDSLKAAKVLREIRGILPRIKSSPDSLKTLERILDLCRDIDANDTNNP